MAYIRLDRDEVDDLPEVCMQCGEPATTTVTKHFSWAPAWAGIVGGAIGQLAMTKRMTVEAPMCDAHRNHWMTRTLIILLSLLGVGIICGLGVLAAVGLEDNPTLRPLAGVLCGLGIVLLIVWIVVALVVQGMTIRPTQITDYEIQLTGIADGFVKAVKKQRRDTDDDDEDDDRPRRRRRY